jgi:hypothetical protein
MYVFLCLFFYLSLVSSQCWRNVSCDGPKSSAFPGPWESNIYSPDSRTVVPTQILNWPNLDPSPFTSATQLHGNGSKITLDFGKEVGGIVTLEFTSSSNGSLGLAFSESKNYIGEWSDSSNGAFKGPDGAIYSNFTAGNSSYTMPDVSLRGGFRYLTLFLITNNSSNSSSSSSSSSSTTVTLKNATIELSFAPTWSNLRAYQGYFDSSSPLLNKIWYAGAYTVQTNTVPTDTGRQVPFLTHGWANNASLGPGDTIIVDGAKRDRAVWPGDMGIAVPATFVSLGDLTSVKNALQVMYNTQNKTTGAFAESGPPLSQQGSDTYHMWTMIGTYNYVLYSGDVSFAQQNWAGYQQAMQFMLDKVSPSPSGHNTEANTILYHTLITGSKLALWLVNATTLSQSWTQAAQTLKTNINTQLLDPSTGSYKDNDTATALHPQDANSMALTFGLAPRQNISQISTSLTSSWSPIGPVSPELPNNISPFITSFELTAHLAARQPQRTLHLIESMWGWILQNANSTQSTLLEGYLANGNFSYRNTRGYAFDESYVSHAHGWSAGPTGSLVTGVLGLDVVDLAGKVWSVRPLVGELEWVRGG